MSMTTVSKVPRAQTSDPLITGFMLYLLNYPGTTKWGTTYPV